MDMANMNVRGGTCSNCGKPVGWLYAHEQACFPRSAPQRPISDYMDEVTEDKVQAVFAAIEIHAATFRPGRPGRWVCDDPRLNFGRNLSGVINEMIRTGLLSHAIYRWGENETHDLVPASRHLADAAMPALSACRFPGEGKGPKRSRLTTDMTVVNCRDCLGSSSLTHEL